MNYLDPVVQLTKQSNSLRSITFSPCDPMLLALSGTNIATQFRDIRFSNKYVNKSIFDILYVYYYLYCFQWLSSPVRRSFGLS